MLLPVSSNTLIVTQAKAYEVAERLENLSRHDTPAGTTIFRGDDARLGTLYVVIGNTTDEAIILPFASQIDTL